MSSEKNNFDLIFVGDSYTQGYGLYYHYWCENKLYHCIDYQERYREVDAVHSGFVDNESLNFQWTNRFPALVASHFNTTYKTNCWEGIGYMSAWDNGIAKSRERPQVASTMLIESYLKYFRKYGNEDRKYFILQVSEITRDTLLAYTHQKGNGANKRIEDILKTMEEDIAENIQTLSPYDEKAIRFAKEQGIWEAVRKLIINSKESIFRSSLNFRQDAPDYIPYPENPSDLLKGNNFEKILYTIWETIWSDMQIELRKYNCELLILHTLQNTYENIDLENTIKVGKAGCINQGSYQNYTIETEIYDKYNIKITESHPGLRVHKEIADSIIQHIEKNYL